MTALGLPYPTIIGIVHGGEWASTVLDRIVADGRYGVRLGQSAADAEAELRTAIAMACAADPFLRDHPATVEIPAAGSARPAFRPITRCPSGWPRSSRPSPAGGPRSSASRTAPTCSCSSTSPVRRA